jgi:hypothetical protein
VHRHCGLREQHADGDGVEQGARRLQRFLAQDLDRQEQADDAGREGDRRQAEVEVVDRQKIKKAIGTAPLGSTVQWYREMRIAIRTRPRGQPVER